MGEKTEKASPKKLRDAKKKGQIAKSQDFPAAATFIASIAITLSSAHSLNQELSRFLVDCFSLVTHPNILEVLGPVFLRAIYVIFITTIPIVGAVCLIGMLVTFLTVGPVFAPEVFKFDLKKFNPIDNLKSKFKMKTVIELLKSLAKITIAGILVYKVVVASIPTLIQSQSVPVAGALNIFAYFLWDVVVKVGLFFGIIAVFDFMYQKHAFNKEMMMEKFEVKQEYKESEGNPEIKGKRREVAREIAYSEGPAAGASRANAVVTNPHLLAIALGFERGLDPCPFILAMGQGSLAQQIIKIAEENRIPTIRNIPLAHTLWEKAKLYEYIPEETYEPVAEIIRWLAELEHEAQVNELKF
jgi:type III secretion protein U